MGSIFFVLKCLVFTVVLVILMQIRIGGTTLEEKALHWTHNSSVMQPIQQVADGSVKALREGWKKTYQWISAPFSNWGGKEWPGQRSLKVNWERSEKVIAEQAKKAKEKAKEQLSRLSSEDETE